jgi:uncharacterized protein with HEPN domain
VPSKHDPVDSLADIIENAERIERYLAGLDRDALAGNGLVRDAVERCLERVCDAAYRLGDRGAELMPDKPWGDIRGLAIGFGTPTTGSVWKSSGTLSVMIFPD